MGFQLSLLSLVLPYTPGYSEAGTKWCLILTQLKILFPLHSGKIDQKKKKKSGSLKWRSLPLCPTAGPSLCVLVEVVLGAPQPPSVVCFNCLITTT